MSRFIKVDELSYFKQMIGDLQSKLQGQPYAERRAFAMHEKMDDVFLENEVHSALEEITQKEKDLQQLI